MTVTRSSPLNKAATSTINVINTKAKNMAYKMREAHRKEALKLKIKKDSQEEVIDVDAVLSIKNDQDQQLLPSLNLQHDEDVLLNGDWLTDSIINQGQNLIKKAFPHIQGLQNVLLGKTLAFSIQFEAVVQVLPFNLKNLFKCYMLVNTK